MKKKKKKTKQAQRNALRRWGTQKTDARPEKENGRGSKVGV
jgi:hypothetical protein